MLVRWMYEVPYSLIECRKDILDFAPKRATSRKMRKSWFSPCEEVWEQRRFRIRRFMGTVNLAVTRILDQNLWKEEILNQRGWFLTELAVFDLFKFGFFGKKREPPGQIFYSLLLPLRPVIEPKSSYSNFCTTWKCESYKVNMLLTTLLTSKTIKWQILHGGLKYKVSETDRWSAERPAIDCQIFTKHLLLTVVHRLPT